MAEEGVCSKINTLKQYTNTNWAQISSTQPQINVAQWINKSINGYVNNSKE